MGPLIKAQAPTLSSRDYIARMMAEGLTRAEAKREYRRLLSLEWWGNEKYSASVERNSLMHGLGDGVICTHISFHRRDREPVTDWRETQAIKNAICGDEAEGLQLFPAESRVVDTANEYHIFVLEHRDGSPLRIPVGWTRGMKRSDTDFLNAKQRPL